jgi:hypothetical protein
MTDTTQAALPSPGERLPGDRLSAGSGLGIGLLALAAVVLGSALLGVAAGYLWAAIAPRALLVVVSRGSADVVNPETSAFIAADGYFSLVCVIGGVVTGVLGYLYAVRRYGALAMLGILGGGLAASFVTRWIGQGSGVAAFNRVLVLSKPGVLLRAPLVLGAHGALAFWPLSAGITAGGIEAVLMMRERRQPLADPPAVPTASAGPPQAAAPQAAAAQEPAAAREPTASSSEPAAAQEPAASVEAAPPSALTDAVADSASGAADPSAGAGSAPEEAAPAAAGPPPGVSSAPEEAAPAAAGPPTEAAPPGKVGPAAS